MRKLVRPVAIFLGLVVAGTTHGQIDDPIPEPVSKRGLAVQIQDLVRLPDSSGLDPARERGPVGWARVSYVRDAA